MPRIEMISTSVTPQPLLRTRKPEKNSSSMWVPLKASPSLIVRVFQLLMPSGWTLLAAAILLTWRLLTVFARGDLVAASTDELMLAVLADVALAQAVATTLRAMSLTSGGEVSPTADVTRSASLMLAMVWMMVTLLRLASLLMAAVDKKPIDPSFFAAAVQDPLAWLSSGAFWVCLVVAAATAALVRYCLTCDMEVAQALAQAESRSKYAGLTIVALLTAIALSTGAAMRADQFGPRSVAQLPEIAAMRALSSALHDPRLRASED